MPYFSIETNQAVDDSSRPDLLKKTSAFVSDLLGKPEQYVMISIEPKTAMAFGGSGQPAAFVRLKSIGLPEERCSEFSEKICGFLQKELGISKDRVFIDFKNLKGHMFGWNAKTF